MAAKRGVVKGSSVHSLTGGERYPVEGDYRPFNRMVVDFVLVPDKIGEQVTGTKSGRLLNRARITRVIGKKGGQ